MRRALFLLTLVAALVFACAGVVLAQQATPDTQRGPASQGAGRYIVVLKDNAPDTRSVADEHSRRYSAQVIHKYEDALKGYAATLSDQALGAIQSDPNVRFVDRDLPVQADAVSSAVPRLISMALTIP